MFTFWIVTTVLLSPLIQAKEACGSQSLAHESSPPVCWKHWVSLNLWLIKAHSTFSEEKVFLSWFNLISNHKEANREEEWLRTSLSAANTQRLLRHHARITGLKMKLAQRNNTHLNVANSEVKKMNQRTLRIYTMWWGQSSLKSEKDLRLKWLMSPWAGVLDKEI